jgi:plasmid maintenance system antidote protein VapI
MRIHNGEYTERGLARLLGISQPQIHHVLKGTRRLQPEFADRIMARFGITVLDLLQDIELSSELRSRQTTLADLRWYTAVDADKIQVPASGELRPRKPAGRHLGSLGRAERAG